jgi:hypothetical protein
MRRIRLSATTAQPGTGRAPPESPVPAPRGTIGMPASRAMRTTSATSSVEPGRRTSLGRIGDDVAGAEDGLEPPRHVPDRAGRHW